MVEAVASKRWFENQETDNRIAMVMMPVGLIEWPSVATGGYPRKSLGMLNIL